MKSKDVVIGMRVVPTQKPVGILQDDFRKTYTVRNANEVGQPYLYVSKWNRGMRCWCLSDRANDTSGDWFNSRGFYPYTGENHEI